MENNKKNQIISLAKKAAAVFGAAFAALTGGNANAVSVIQGDNYDVNTIQIKENFKVKPMPVLKLNFSNPEDSQFVSSHTSHSSHRSHSSHSSHSSHYSHRSGAMFS